MAGLRLLYFFAFSVPHSFFLYVGTFPCSDATYVSKCMDKFGALVAIAAMVRFAYNVAKYSQTEVFFLKFLHFAVHWMIFKIRCRMMGISIPILPDRNNK